MILSEIQYFYIAFSALLVGFTKTSVGGVGILAVLLMALAIPGKGSPGVLLPMLIMADIFAVLFYRRKCQWHLLVKLIPLTALGVISGYFLLDIISADLFGKIIGFVILCMVLLEIFLGETKSRHVKGWWVTAIVGIAGGVATMIANAAGPIFGIYLLRMGFNKEEYVGTRSWYFLLINLFKVPFSANLGLITMDSVKLNLMFFPVILIGAFAGFWLLKIINLTLFKWAIRIAAFVASLRLIFY